MRPPTDKQLALLEKLWKNGQLAKSPKMYDFAGASAAIDSYMKSIGK
jgi:hypothetical protein